MSNLKDKITQEIKALVAKEIAEWKQAVEKQEEKQKQIARMKEKRIGFKF